MDFHLHGVECNFEFWPVEHPVEPMEEDQPVKCPIPETYAINDNKGYEEQSSEVLRRKAKSLAVKDKREMLVVKEAPFQVMRKRHHRLGPMNNVYPFPPSNSSHKFEQFSQLKS